MEVAVDQQDRHREVERGKRQENQERVDCGHPGKQRQPLDTHARRKQSSDDEELYGDGTDTNGQDATVERIAAEKEYPLAPRIEPREGNVPCTDLQRDHVVAKRQQRRRCTRKIMVVPMQVKSWL